MSGRFFHARQSIELDKGGRFNLRPASTKSRSALHERTPSDLNRENGEQPTIRLVGSNTSLKNVYDKNPFPNKPTQVLQPPKSSKHGYTIQNDQGSSSIDSKVLQPLTGQTGRLSAQSTNNRHSKRSSNFSQSTTTSTADTYCNDSFSPTSARFSMDGTLRNTPTPIASEEREKERLREAEALPAVAETSFESSTIRPVTASSSSGPGSRGSDTTNKNVVSRLPHGRSVSAGATSASGSSGPNIEVYDVSSPSQYSSTPPEHSRSNSYNVIRYAKSTESMASVQYAEVRPPTAQSLSASSAWSAGETENLQPLSVAKKRSHLHSASTGVVRMSNLSTIASESEPSSQSIIREFSDDIFTSPPVMQPPSQSGNWYVRRQTIGSSSYSSIMTDSNYMSAESSRWELDRENSAVPEPLFSSSPHGIQQPSSPVDDHPSSSGIHELSAEHPSEQDDTIAELQTHPLRTQRSGLLPRGRSFSEPRPVSARSNHTLVTMNNPDRTSQGSSIFPQWAKSFYRGKLHFPHGNESTVSLALSDGQLPQHSSAAQSVRMMPWAHHRRWESAGNSLMSLPQSQGTPHNASPKSSHFLPSIFRPYHPRANTNQSQSTNDMSVVTRSSSLAELYVDESQLDFSEGASSSSSSTNSMAITVIPRGRHNSAPVFQPPRRQQTVNSGRAIPRDQTYSSSNYPQSLAASRMYTTPPHLAPSRRLSHRLSTWRAPSFDEALNTLVISRGNRQILFFCLGFLCPVLWMVAAFLPLPLRPTEFTVNNVESSIQDFSELEGEKSHYPRGLQAEMRNWDQERKYLKARWWRNLNRIMSFVGVAMIGAIIALAVIASK
ncbi:hypothetical protein E4T39_01719 [Aureobasidium subglaciale]|nr:hypothetical protein E4T39_01719 [Aureobasidium subglaciale]